MTLEQVQSVLDSVQQSRSRYQLERFVLGQHDTPEMRFFQLCLELRAALSAQRRMELQAKRFRASIAKLRVTGDPVDAVDAEITELNAAEHDAEQAAHARELAILLDLFDSIPHFTRDEIERAEPDYWRARLLRQAELQHAGAQTGVGWAHLEALQQAGELQAVLEGPPAPTGQLNGG